MPDQTKIIKQDGSADYTTIQAFLNDTDVSDGYWQCIVKDANEYGRLELDIGDIIGVPTFEKNIRIRVDPSVMHEGVAGNTHARIKNTTAGKYAVYFNQIDWVSIKGLEIEQANTDNFIGSVGMEATTGTNISQCIVHSSAPIGLQKSGIKPIGNGRDFSIDNTFVYGFFRGISTSDTFTDDQDFYLDHCTVTGCTEGIHLSANNGGDTTVTAFNVLAIGNGTDFFTGTVGSGGTIVWAGSHNGCSDESLTIAGLTVGKREGMIEQHTIRSPTNLLLVKLNDAANDAVDNGLNRVGSEPYAIQDFSIDVEGKTRPRSGTKVSIGASEHYTVLNSVSVSGAIDDKLGMPSKIDSSPLGVSGAIDTDAIGVVGLI